MLPDKSDAAITRFEMIEQVSNSNKLYDAFILSQCGSNWKESVQRYEVNLLRNIFKTQYLLESNKYSQKPFYEFDLNERGKHRHIKSLHISDRVVQRSLCDNVLTPKTTNLLTYDNGASIKNKGITFSRKRIQVHLRKYYEEFKTNDGYILQIDFKKFFDSIPHKQLKEKMKMILSEEEFNLFCKLLDTFSINGEKRSVGIGSQISQICGVYYPTSVDNYIKNVLGIKYYGRYMDDSYIIHPDKEYLKKLLKKYIEMSDSLGLTVNIKKTQIVKLSHGFTYLKIKYNPEFDGRIVKRLSRKAIIRERRKLKKYRIKFENSIISLPEIVQAYASWRGSYSKFNSHKSVRCMDQLYNSLFGGIYYENEYKRRNRTKNQRLEMLTC